MKCPQCSGELKYPDYAYFNMSSYGKACTIKTDCCGKAVRLIPRLEVEAVSARGMLEDDWGNEINE